MLTKTDKIEISFRQLLSLIDQLAPEEKIIIRKRLDREEVPTWQERFGRALKLLGAKNKKFTESEVEKDVKMAVAEVRRLEKNKSGC